MSPPGGGAPPGTLRSGAFHAGLAELWTEDPDRPGSGRLRGGAAERVPSLCALLIATDPSSRAGQAESARSAAFLLGLLAEADAPEEEAVGVRAALDAHLDVILESVARAGPGGEAPDPLLLQGLLYPLSLRPERAEEIVRALTGAVGADGWELHAVKRAFSLSRERPAWARAVTAYLGAQACAAVGADRLELARRTLACPACGGGLDFAPGGLPAFPGPPPGEDAEEASREGSPEHRMECGDCGGVYPYVGDVLDLVPPGTEDAVEFSPELVASYEEVTRPRFVRVMGGDWAKVLTPEYEEEYLRGHLRPVEGPVLDLACGAGGWTRRVARLVGEQRVVALDYSLAMVEACLEQVPSVLPVRGSASRLPVADAVLGGANCSDALQALPDPAAALGEVARCLRPGAPLTLFTFLEGAEPYRYFQHRFPLHPRRLFTPDGLRSMVEAAGLELTDWGAMGEAVFLTARKPAGAPPAAPGRGPARRDPTRAPTPADPA